MSGLLTGILSTIDQLANLSQTQRVVVTAIILLGVAGAIWGTRHFRPRVRERFHTHVANVASLAVVLGVGLVALISLLVLWGIADNALHALDQVNATAGKGVKFAIALVVVAGAYVANGFAKRGLDRFVDANETITQHQSEIIYRISQLTIYVAAVAIILGLWNVNLSGLLVGAGFLGIVVGMAARQTLGALLAGFVLMFSRPFEIGDWVQIDDEEGIVTDISIVNTRIQTFAGEYVMIPNDIVSGTKIVNKSRKGRLRIEVEVGVDYAADVERSAEVAKEAMKGLDEILTVPTPQVVVKTFGDSAVTLGLRFWIDKPSARRRWRARSAVIKSVKQALEDEGIKIPYPQRELTGRQETDGFRVAGEPTPTATTERASTESAEATDSDTPKADGGEPE